MRITNIMAKFVLGLSVIITITYLGQLYQMQSQMIFDMIKIVVLLVFTVTVAIEYLKFRYRSMLLFLGALGLYTLSQCLGFFYRPEYPGSGQFYYNISFQLMSTIFSFYLILLFLDSFANDSVLTRRNVLLAFVAGVQETMSIISVILLSSFPENVNEQLGPGRISEALPLIYENSRQISFITIILGTILFAIIATLIISTIIHRLRTMSEPNQVHKMRRILLGMTLIIIGVLMAAVLSNIGIRNTYLGTIVQNVSMIIGLLILMRYTIFENGMFLFQGDNLKKLLIINPFGTPIYSYTFWAITQEEINQNLETIENNEVLFSGALISISMLLSETTGNNNSIVEEIGMNTMKLMVQTISNGYSIVLMVEKSTSFFRSALMRFSDAMVEMVENTKDGEVFDSTDVKVANAFLESSFGQMSYL